MTKAGFVLRRAAQRDINSHADYLETEAGKDVALRFVDSARASFAYLGTMPKMGTVVPTRKTKLEGLRKWRITGFPKYLICYRNEHEHVRIFRVLHGAQDWWAAPTATNKDSCKLKTRSINSPDGAGHIDPAVGNGRLFLAHPERRI